MRVFLALAVLLAAVLVVTLRYGVSASSETSTVQVGNVRLTVTTEGTTQLRLTSSTTVENGVGFTCLRLSVDNTTNEFCEAADAAPTAYACAVRGTQRHVAGTCTCEGVCAGLANGCADLGGTVTEGVCTF